jgi:hypothetical protein
MSVIITDISSDGCKLSCRKTLPIGEFIELSVPGCAIFKAQVRWWRSGEAGLFFTGLSLDPRPNVCGAANDLKVSLNSARAGSASTSALGGE